METLITQGLEPNGWLGIAHGFVPEHEALLARLRDTLPLRTESLRMMGREVLTPRLVSWHGDPGATYAYSGRRFDPQPWTDDLTALRDRLSQLLGAPFNSVLVNYYRDGRDSMGFHADNEPELGPDAPSDVLIASVSLGAPRRFVIKQRKGSATIKIDLGKGDLYVMGGAAQQHWVHGVPKTARPVGPRMSLTFRIIRVLR